MNEISTAGIILYIIYPVLLISMSFYSIRGREVTSRSYFFAGTNAGWPVLGISFLSASVLGPYLFIQAGGVKSPLVSAISGLISVIILLLLRQYIIPLYLKLQIKTFPEYFEIKYNRKCKLLLSAIYIIINVISRLSVIIIMGSILLNIVSGYDVFTSLIYFLVITGLFVIIGGLQSELNVNMALSAIFIISAAAVAGWGFFPGSEINYMRGSIIYLEKFAYPEAGNINIIEAAAGIPVIVFWFWCADQMVLQKIVSAKDEGVAKKSVLFTALLQIIPVFIFITASSVLASIFMGSGPFSFQQEAMPSVSLPGWMRLAVSSAVISILMISAAGIFNSTSVLVTYDFYRTFTPEASDRKLVLVGRLTTLILLLFSILVIPTSQSLNFSVCIKLLKGGAYFAAMISSLFLAGTLSKKISPVSVITALSALTIIILLRIGSEFLSNGREAEAGIFSWLKYSGFMEFSALIFLLTAALLFLSALAAAGYTSIRAVLHNQKAYLARIKYKWNAHRKVFLVLLFFFADKY